MPVPAGPRRITTSHRGSDVRQLRAATVVTTASYVGVCRDPPIPPDRSRSDMTFLIPSRPITTLDEYLATGTGGLGIETAQNIGPEATIATIAAAGLRGRGGGGFPTGRKWAGIATQAGT